MLKQICTQISAKLSMHVHVNCYLKKLHDVVKDALTAFSQEGLKSVALPAIGTGNMEFPKSKVAQVMVAAAVDFLSLNPQSTLMDVQFVSYFDSDMHMVSFTGLPLNKFSMIS